MFNTLNTSEDENKKLIEEFCQVNGIDPAAGTSYLKDYILNSSVAYDAFLKKRAEQLKADNECF